MNHTSCEFRCKLDARKCNSGKKQNNSKCQWDCKKPIKH